jgi:hypothetical protein
MLVLLSFFERGFKGGIAFPPAMFRGFLVGGPQELWDVFVTDAAKWLAGECVRDNGSCISQHAFDLSISAVLLSIDMLGPSPLTENWSVTNSAMVLASVVATKPTAMVFAGNMRFVPLGGRAENTTWLAYMDVMVFLALGIGASSVRFQPCANPDHSKRGTG